MVIKRPSRTLRQRGTFFTELLVAIMLLASALLPIAYSIASEKRLARTYYDRTVAMEIVDGEMEVLLAGGWRNFAPGTHPYPVSANAVTNLSNSSFFVTINSNRVRLEWRSTEKHRGGSVVREATVK